MNDQHPDGTVAAQAAPAESLTDEDIDAVLAGLAAVADQLIADTATAEQAVSVLNDDNERSLVLGQVGPGYWSRPNPNRALTKLRLAHACRTARDLRDASRHLVAWWADLATYAALSAAAGQPVPAYRAAAADPSAILDEEELRRLPYPTPEERQFAGLAAALAGTPGPHPDDNLHAVITDYVARAGLTLQPSPNGGMVVADDTIDPNARLPRLWTDTWTDHQMPALLTAEQLGQVLDRIGLPPTATDEIRAATTNVDDVLAAARHLRDTADDESASDSEALYDHIDRTTDILADYARTLTRHLPMVRTSAGRHRTSLPPAGNAGSLTRA
ncbi:hypothetical protein [Micromonospora sp. LOL_024]|uniref:hypothetical protein n=1 Tax=Micromonospora sp. LOL_024 TaxID=3345412 RepID=UPI003A88E559